MSRSYKKFPSHSDGNKQKKQIANRALRHRNNQLEIDEDTIFLNSSEVVNDYDIIDYKFTDYNDSEEYIKYKRK